MAIRNSHPDDCGSPASIGPPRRCEAHSSTVQDTAFGIFLNSGQLDQCTQPLLQRLVAATLYVICFVLPEIHLIRCEQLPTISFTTRIAMLDMNLPLRKSDNRETRCCDPALQPKILSRREEEKKWGEEKEVLPLYVVNIEYPIQDQATQVLSSIFFGSRSHFSCHPLFSPAKQRKSIFPGAMKHLRFLDLSIFNACLIKRLVVSIWVCDAVII